ncbi:MAG: PQQ-binding-like beta-propeller repeat protein [Ilumatobacteraceae bacterium]
MASDPDALWKPGGPGAAPEVDRAPTEPVLATGLPDRFQPAVRRTSTTVQPSVGPVDADSEMSLDVAAPEVLASDGWVVEPDEEGAGSDTSRRRWRVAVPIVLVVAALVVGAVVVARIVSDDTDPGRPGELAGTDVRRLPAAAEELWSTTLGGTGNLPASSIVVDGRDLAVVVVDDGSRSRTSVVGLDAGSGEVRWQRSLPFAPPEASFLGVMDGAVVMELTDRANRRLLALSSADGETLWERRIGGSSFNAVLLGTDIVANTAPEVPDRTTFYDPATGDVLGEVLGNPVTTDLDGTWYYTLGRDLVRVDLADGWSEPVVVVEDGPRLTGQVVVIGERILVADAAGRLRELDREDKRLVPVAGDDLPEITAMFPAGGSSFVVVNQDEIVGAELDERGVRLTWSLDATMRSLGLTEQGMVLAVSDSGIGFDEGIDFQVVDGLTGERLARAAAVDNVEHVPLIVGNGVVTVTEVVEGDERRGFDLEGNELWRVVLDGRLEVGDELVVVLDNTDSGYRVTAYGSAG